VEHRSIERKLLHLPDVLAHELWRMNVVSGSSQPHSMTFLAGSRGWPDCDEAVLAKTSHTRAAENNRSAILSRSVLLAKLVSSLSRCMFVCPSGVRFVRPAVQMVILSVAEDGDKMTAVTFFSWMDS
jgi:hypothetical protein